MKKLIICATAAVTTLGSFNATKAAARDRGDNSSNITSANTSSSVDGHIQAAYNRINFGGNRLSFDVFKKAYTGFLNLKSAGKVNRDILTVADFSKPSSTRRLWVIDLRSNRVVFNDLVAHGQGSGGSMATQFSNTNNSHQSSLGFYVTGETYTGKHGRSLRMNGMDQGFNHSARSRAVVIHGAKYVNSARAASGSIGRSWGCPAVSEQIAQPLISAIQGGSVLFIYAPQQNYLQSSQWLNRTPNTKQLAMNAPLQGNSVAYA